jgi:hypothetical protein
MELTETCDQFAAASQKLVRFIDDQVKADPTLQKYVVQFSCDCAERTLNIFETSYSEDVRPRQAIETARSWCEGKATLEDVQSAYHLADLAAYATAPGDRSARAAAFAAAFAAFTALATLANAVSCSSLVAHTAIVASSCDSELAEWQRARLMFYLKTATHTDKVTGRVLSEVVS